MFLGTFALITSTSLLFVTNFVMALYDQIDAIPVFYSTNMIFNSVCGLILLGEAARYSTGNLIGISIGVAITVAGIFVLAMKKNLIAKEGEAELDAKIKAAFGNIK